MKVQNMTNSNGNKVPNQFIIKEDENRMSGNCIEYFQSYNSIIAKRDKFRAGVAKCQVWLDESKWDYSKTTGKYRNQFLGETKKETEAKIKSGEYILTDLNS
jgi:hypothetical protein